VPEVKPWTIAAGIVLATTVLAGCGATISKAPAAQTSSGVAAPLATDLPSAPVSSPSSSAPLSGPAGTTFTVTSSSGSSYTVTLDQVEQQATAAPYVIPQNAGDHFAAVQFTITGVAGNTSDDANSDASAIGSDQQQYPFAATELTVPNFNSGLFNVGPGQVVKGWVAFELPSGVTIASVQWAPVLDPQAATWKVGVLWTASDDFGRSWPARGRPGTARGRPGVS
jgi:hypothetical protein